MRYRKLGETEVEVSEVGFGLWTLTAPWWRPPPEAEGVALLRRAYEAGITYFEIGPYGEGRGEALLRAAFTEQRDMVVLAAKFPAGAALGPAVDASLDRLGTSFLDIAFLDTPPMAAMQTDAPFSELDALREQGKIRYWGVSLGPGVGHYEQGMHAIKKRFAAVVAHEFSVLEQEPGRLLFTASLEGNTGNVLRGVHASGPMGGSYDPAATFADPERQDPRRREFLQWAEVAAKNLSWIHEGRGLTLGQAAIKFALAEETVSTVLPDIRNASQLAECAAAPDREDYSQQDLARIAELYRKGFNAPRPG
jgi:aryl-alcohol dehydrogenase-like predicted oxidoreductase